MVVGHGPAGTDVTPGEVAGELAVSHDKPPGVGVNTRSGQGMTRRRRRSVKMSRNIASVSTNSWKPNRRAFVPSANMS
ncbi:hypothetical protein SAMN05444320_107146 [Streptoalloteichus hindustanus]|uniref:Uncharacterized protein n=1 Tax=Streptoalloteichus hindustanus TaxID=2017 RepID=A0A1M5I7E5_STRHI|nr:hypothetical protein SAMN05444320_107146 [Streptoalloteichus hindustanus]